MVRSRWGYKGDRMLDYSNFKKTTDELMAVMESTVTNDIHKKDLEILKSVLNQYYDQIVLINESNENYKKLVKIMEQNIVKLMEQNK